MIIGIFALLFSCCYGGFLGLIGLPLGIIGVSKPKNGTAIAGIITSGFALLITIMMIIMGNGSLVDYVERSKDSATENNISTEDNQVTEDNVPTVDGQSTEDTSSSEPSTEEIIEITAETICISYDENEVNCKNTYEGKHLRVTGVIEDIGIDILDQQYVILYGGSYANTYVTLHCTMAEGVDISTLSKDSTITVSGYYENGVLGPNLNDCIIE